VLGTSLISRGNVLVIGFKVLKEATRREWKLIERNKKKI